MVGFGYTEVPEDITDLTLDFWVSHIIGFLDALGIARDSFIGNNYGGALSVAVAARPPERVDRFALMGAGSPRCGMDEGMPGGGGLGKHKGKSAKLMENTEIGRGGEERL